LRCETRWGGAGDSILPKDFAAGAKRKLGAAAADLPSIQVFAALVTRAAGDYLDPKEWP
jgi:hypothetical protein